MVQQMNKKVIQCLTLSQLETFNAQIKSWFSDCFSLRSIIQSFLVFSAAQHLKLAFHKACILRIHSIEKLFLLKHRGQRQVFPRLLAVRKMAIKTKQSCGKTAF